MHPGRCAGRQRLLEVMQQLLPILVAATIITWILATGLTAAVLQARRDRRRVMADGMSTEGTITRVLTRPGAESCRVTCSFEPLSAAMQVECAQNCTPAALALANLREGSRTRVYYHPKHPGRGFIYALAVAERVATITAAASPSADGRPSPDVYFVSYTAPARSLRTSGALGQTLAAGFRGAGLTALRCSGPGDLAFVGSKVYFTAMRAIPFWVPRTIRYDFALDSIANVETFGNTVRCEIHEPGATPRAIQFWTVDAADTKAIADRLPQIKTGGFVSRLSDQAEFNARLLGVSPRAPVTPALVGLNTLIFVTVALLGGGIFTPNTDALIRFGTNYTPLVLAGEWWRLFTSMFLHFGLMHLVFNMIALMVFGVLAERLFGSCRYLLIYLMAGLAGSVASFLWHPFVNSAGASGAIFGVLGSLLAFFLRRKQGVPISVLKTQRNSAAVYIAYTLLNGARAGVDNAAHLGGLVTGLSMGLLLARPLDATRSERSWSGQWLQVCTVIAIVATYVGMSLESGRLHPRLLLDSQGRVIPTSMLGPPLRSYAGVTLGMTQSELLKSKGAPARRESANHWMYNSIDDAHDGLLDVYFNSGPKDYPGGVDAVLFWGNDNAAPPGLPHLMGLTREDLIRQFGGPTYQPGERPGGEYVGFRNGLIVRIESGKTRSYGIWVNPSQ